MLVQWCPWGYILAAELALHRDTSPATMQMVRSKVYRPVLKFFNAWTKMTSAQPLNMHMSIFGYLYDRHDKPHGWFATYAAVLVCWTSTNTWECMGSQTVYYSITWQHTCNKGLLCMASAEAWIVCHYIVFELTSTYMIHLQISWCYNCHRSGIVINKGKCNMNICVVQWPEMQSGLQDAAGEPLEYAWVQHTRQTWHWQNKLAMYNCSLLCLPACLVSSHWWEFLSVSYFVSFLFGNKVFHHTNP